LPNISGQPVIDVHVVHDRQVELVEHQLLGHVGGKLGMADDHGYGPCAPALVRRLELLRAAERERRHHIQHQAGGVIVIAQDDDVGLFLKLPLFHPLVAGEHRLPIFLVRLAHVEGGADGGNVAGRHAGSDASH
jgi:hypothetical protein